MYKTKIKGTGSYLPEKILTNADIEKIVQTSDEWITTRTGIQQRRIADENTATSDLAIKAARKALENANLTPDDIDAVIVATITPDMFFPSTACFVQKELDIKNAAAFDVLAACSGFIYGLSIAKAYIETGVFKNILLIGAETLSKITDYTDRNTCILFGDGAGAMIIGRSEDEKNSILSIYMGADGHYDYLLNLPGGGSRNPMSAKMIDNRLNYMKMAGKEVFRVAVTKMSEAAEQALKDAGKSVNDLALVIPHQANIRIIEAIAKKLDFPMEKVFINIHKYGNVSAATTIIGLDEARREGKVKEGDIVELVAFGGGFTWGAAVLQL
jgi:3-oxoacyl-[acyl-carrier-protein] synthase-3